MSEQKKRTIIKRPLFRDEIKAVLLESIESGELLPGERIVETRLAKEYGVSQSPIREAIRELEMLGVVETIPYKGSFVRKVEKKDMVDVFKTRSTLEVSAVKEAVDKITKDDFDEMDHCIDEMKRALDEKEVHHFVDMDTRFHEIFVEASGNNFLHKIWNQCYNRDTTWLGAKYAQPALMQITQHHEKIKESIESGDEIKAVEAVEEHFQMIIDLIE